MGYLGLSTRIAERDRFSGFSRVSTCLASGQKRHVRLPAPPLGGSLGRRDTDTVESGVVYQLPVQRRHFVVDERGIGLRATWHLDRGFVNVSLWRDDRCVETFHLTPAEAGRLIGFLASGLGDAVSAQAPSPLVSAVPAPADPLPRESVVSQLPELLQRIRRDVAEALARVAARIDP